MTQPQAIAEFYQCNQERTQALNDRIFSRNLPSQQMQSVFDPRPVRTRQVLFPMVDCRLPSTVPVIQRSTYTQEGVFNPGTSAPFDGYQAGIDKESRLQSRFFPLQKADQAQYLPSTHSDMYRAYPVQSAPLQSYELTNDPHTETNLYTPAEEHARDTWGHPHPNPFPQVGGDLFYNHTKTQVKNLSTSTVMNASCA